MEIKYETNIMGEVPREFKAELFDFLENKVIIIYKICY